MLEPAESDTLILLDCCAAASSAASNDTGRGVTEFMIACGFESSAPGVCDHTFTRSIIDEIKILEPSTRIAIDRNATL
jgi:hypothetical protein